MGPSEAQDADPLVTVVVPSHRRADGLTTHRDVAEPPGARQLVRNLGWRAARGELIAFTDDDCRPAPDWLERLVERALEYPGAIVQGTTRPDPRDESAFASPHVRTIWVEAPGRDTQTCNILYERAQLARIGGFDERFPAAAGEDIDLALRAQASGAVLVGAPDALVYHAIDALSLREKVQHDRKWAHLVYLVKRHPELRRRPQLLVPILALALSASVVFASDAVTRYRAPLEPLIVVLACSGASVLLPRLRRYAVRGRAFDSARSLG